jgi:hypothetical protein
MDVTVMITHQPKAEDQAIIDFVRLSNFCMCDTVMENERVAP